MLRTSFGFLRSSPTNAIYVEVGLLPPNLRAAFITDKFVLKFSNFNERTKAISFQNLFELKEEYQYWITKSPPLIVNRLAELSETREQIFCSESDFSTLENTNKCLAINTQFPIKKKGHPENLPIFDTFRDLHRDKIFLYTDGSKTSDITTAAVVSKELQIKRTYILNQNRVIMSAELKAIRECLRMICLYNVRKAVVCSDSLSAITKISNFSKSDDPELLEIRKIFSSNNDLILTWTPGHEGIEGNVLADQQTKVLTDATDLSLEKIHYSNFLKSNSKKILHSWQESWTDSIIVKGARLGAIQPTVALTSWFEEIILLKKYTNIISRMRIGHGTFPQHLHRINIVDSNLCSSPNCNEVGSLNHILLHCSHLQPPSTILAILETNGVHPDTIDSILILKHCTQVMYEALKAHLITNNITC